MKVNISKMVVLFIVASVCVFASCSSETIPGNGDPVFLPTGDLVYVCGSTGDDGNPGTAREPMKTIQAAIDYADTQYDTASVIVAAGTYSSNFNTDGTGVVTLIEGVSLYGGYSCDFSRRDTTVYETTLQDTSTDGGILSNPNRAVDGDGSTTAITSETIVDGFFIQGGGGDQTAAVYNNEGSAPTIQNNDIHGGTGSVHSFGVLNSSSDPLIEDNDIDGGDAGSNAYGIYNILSSPVIQNNSILGGDYHDTTRTFAVFNTGSSPTIQNNDIDAGIGAPSYGMRSESGSTALIINNTIHGGTQGLSYGVNDVSSDTVVRNNTIIVGGAATLNAYPVYLGLGSQTVIENNVLITEGGTYRCGICEEDTNDDPASVRYNDIYHVGISGGVLYEDADGGGEITDIATMEQTLQNEGADAEGNVTLDPQFDAGSADGLYLSSSSPASVAQEGCNGAHSNENWGYTTDKDGAQRSPLDDSSTQGWSMGAYEY